VPNPTTIQPVMNYVYTRMSANPPFSYLMQIYGIVAGQTITTSTPVGINLVLPASVTGLSTDTLAALPILGSDTLTPIRTFANNMRPYAIAGLYLYYVTFVLRSLREIFTT